MTRLFTPAFLVGFVDSAITGAKASGCVPAAEIAYLTDLRVRLLQQKTGRVFATEISNFRQKLAVIVADKCGCK